MFGGSFAASGGGGGGGLFGGGGSESGGGGLFGGGSYNSVGGGFGGTGAAGYGGAVPSTQSLGGYLAERPEDGAATVNGSAAGAPRDRTEQTLMPLTLRMLLDAYHAVGSGERRSPDTPLVVNGKELSMFTFVAHVESVQDQSTFRCYNVNDSTGRIAVKSFNDGCDAFGGEIRAGEYARIFGTLRCWGSDLHVSAQHVARLESPNELPFHFIEVAHVHLGLTGKLPKQAPIVPKMPEGGATLATSFATPARGQAPGGSGQACFKCGQEGHWSRDCTNARSPTQGRSATQGGGGGNCFKCGGTGHWARDCTGAPPSQMQPSSGPGGMPPPGVSASAPAPAAVGPYGAALAPQSSAGSYGASAAPIRHTSPYGAPAPQQSVGQYGAPPPQQSVAGASVGQYGASFAQQGQPQTTSSFGQYGAPPPQGVSSNPYGGGLPTDPVGMMQIAPAAQCGGGSMMGNPYS